jgi:hypothetical protein
MTDGISGMSFSDWAQTGPLAMAQKVDARIYQRPQPEAVLNSDCKLVLGDSRGGSLADFCDTKVSGTQSVRTAADRSGDRCEIGKGPIDENCEGNANDRCMNGGP